MSVPYSPPSPGPIARLPSFKNKDSVSNNALLKRSDSLDDFFGTPKNITVIGSKYSDDEENLDDGDEEFFSDSGEMLTSVPTSSNLKSKKSLFFDTTSIHSEDPLNFTSETPETTATNNSEIKTSDSNLEISKIVEQKITNDEKRNISLQQNEPSNQKNGLQAHHQNIDDYMTESKIRNEHIDRQQNQNEIGISNNDDDISNIGETINDDNSNLDAEKSPNALIPTKTSSNPSVDKISLCNSPETQDSVKVTPSVTPSITGSSSQDSSSATNLNHFLMPSNSQKSSNPSVSKYPLNSVPVDDENSNTIIDKYIKVKKFLVSTNTSSSITIMNNMVDLPASKSTSNPNSFKRKNTFARKISSSASSPHTESFSNIAKKDSSSSLSQQQEHTDTFKRRSTISLSRLNLDPKSNGELADMGENSAKTLTPSKSKESKNDLFLLQKSTNDGAKSSSYSTRSSSSSPIMSTFSGLSTGSTNSLRKSKPFSSLRKRSDVFSSFSQNSSTSSSPKKDTKEEPSSQTFVALESQKSKQKVSSSDLRNPRRKKSLSLEKSSFLRKNVFANRSYDPAYMEELQKKLYKPLQPTSANDNPKNNSFSPTSAKFFSESAPTTPASYKTNFGPKSSNLENSNSMSSFNTLAKSGMNSLHKKKSTATLSSSADNVSTGNKSDKYHSYRSIEKNSLRTDLDDLLNAD